MKRQGLAISQGLAYGLPGLPLAFAALPLYVVLPNYYARHLGLSLASIGGLLMAVRLADALIEPWLGRVSDALLARSATAVLTISGLLAGLHGLGMAGLFFPPVSGQAGLALWLVAGLLLTCIAHSLLVISHQGWGIRLGGDTAMRGQIVAWREGLGVVGVIAASGLSVVGGVGLMLVVLALALLLGAAGWWLAPRPVADPEVRLEPVVYRPLKQPEFRHLLIVFLCNGIASAIPAGLLLFFAQDRLLATQAQIAGCLVLYFVCAAAAMPLWLRAASRFGLAHSWMAGMGLAMLGFVWAGALGSGQVAGFAWICALTGLALGADLALPGTLLAQLIGRHGAQETAAGAYLGWWNLTSKFNLALAAGATLPLLQWLGYAPGSRDAQALAYLSWIYAGLPILLKLAAAALLWRLRIGQQTGRYIPRRAVV